MSDSNSAMGYDSVAQEYLQKRQLKQGAAGWILLAGLGVSYVISGDFAGWNFGLAQGGFGGMLIATVIMGIMYTCMVLSLAELSSSLPTAGGGYSYARRALGRTGGPPYYLNTLSHRLRSLFLSVVIVMSYLAGMGQVSMPPFM